MTSLVYTALKKFAYNIKSSIAAMLDPYISRPINYTKNIYSQPWMLPEIMLFENFYDAQRPLNIFIVGCSECSELKSLSRTKKLGQALLLDPSRSILFKDLNHNIKKYAPDATFLPIAAGEVEGELLLHSTSRTGNDSLLPISKITEAYGIQQAQSYKVKVTTLDHLSQSYFKPDLLWIDVQGYELTVLRGARQILQSVNLIMLEISVEEPTYLGGCTLDQLSSFLDQYNFKLCQLGTNPKNLTRNALFKKVI